MLNNDNFREINSDRFVSFKKRIFLQTLLPSTNGVQIEHQQEVAIDALSSFFNEKGRPSKFITVTNIKNVLLFRENLSQRFL